MSQICSCCGNKLKNSEHYEVICRDATQHQERLERVDDLENKDKEKKEESRKSDEEEIKKDKVNDTATLKARLHEIEKEIEGLDTDELDELLESLRAQLEELEKLKPDEDKQSREASLEYLAIEPQHNKINGDHLMTGVTATNKSNYSALVFSQNYRDRKPGDQLLIRLGSVG